MRKQRGMTQAQVARAMGVSQARVSRMEHGDFDQATTTFVDYTDALTA